MLGFEDVAESLISTAERKDQKRSDPNGGKPSHYNSLISSRDAARKNVTTVKISVDKKVEAHTPRLESAVNHNNHPDEGEEYETEGDEEQAGDNEPSTNIKNYLTVKKEQQAQEQKQQQKVNSYDKQLLIQQEQYKPTLPKVIITASASVSDANGKKLNYSLGNVIGQGLKIAPPTYDDYKEDDVILDPFFLDVPKLNSRVTSSSSSSRSSNNNGNSKNS